MRVKNTLLKVPDLSQEEEARLGWASANDQLPDVDEVEIIVWDSGGGSFQVTRPPHLP